MTPIRPINVLSLILLMLLVYVLYTYADQSIVLVAHNHRDMVFYQIAENMSILAKPAVWDLCAVGGLILAAYTRYRTGSKQFPLWAKQLLFLSLSILLASAWVTLGKFLSGRIRPNDWVVTTEYGLRWLSPEWMESSMPSGHTGVAFAIASSVALCFRRWAVPAYFIAVIFGVCRIVAVRHFPSDVIVGAYLGISASWFVYSVYDWKGLTSQIAHSESRRIT